MALANHPTAKRARTAKEPIEAKSLRRSNRLARLSPATNVSLGIDCQPPGPVKKRISHSRGRSLKENVPCDTLPYQLEQGPKSTRTLPSKDACIESWLGTIPDRIAPESEVNMAQKQGALPLSPDKSWIVPSSLSKKSGKSTASVHDQDYRTSLVARNIFIDKVDPPAQVIQQAKRIVSRSRSSPEPDTPTLDDLKRTLRKLQDAGEDKLVRQAAGQIIPAMDKVPDDRLESAFNQLWSNRVPVPFKSRRLAARLPLPVPKPDVAFGYSENAFSEEQQETIDLVGNDAFGQSYTMPVQGLYFPFLSVEFKSQASGGTLFTAQNQVAGAGAIAMNNQLELARKCSSLTEFNYMEPQFFSVSMDHSQAYLNVHWISKATKTRAHGFHLENISKHILEDPAGARAIIRAVKNILDESVGSRLKTLCEAIDKCGKKLEAEVAQSEEVSANAVETQQQHTPENPRPAKMTRKRNTKDPKTKQKGATVQKPRRASAPVTKCNPGRVAKNVKKN